MRVLVAGWFSFPQMGATVGDLLSRDLVAEWLTSAGVDYDFGVAAPFESEGVLLQDVDASSYDGIVFVCGPFGNGPPITEFLQRFEVVPVVGINLSMLQSLEQWNPFDVLFERDSTRASNPDISFLARNFRVPVIGSVKVHAQSEYGDQAAHGVADRAVAQLLANTEAAVVPIDTRLDANTTGLRTAREIETLIARMDAVVSTRLHGAVLAIKNGVPAVAVDPIAGGAKITAQMGVIGWPVCFTAEDLDEAGLSDALAYCLTSEARELARQCAARAVTAVEEMRHQFISAFRRMQ